ncbi:uncharacterized protein LOC106673725 [Cimex lectularius]|uniref:Uncharacterized protein n=1 Tax=Cimex lectularius TaxID=79782 RepID=A0A8I6THN9_CIMLE|nr:uncharacterized protein LOC106673725 [Cimex lectularius]
MAGLPVFAFVMAYIADKLTTHYHWPSSYFRKIFASIGCYGACICISFTLYINGPNSVTMFILATYFYGTLISNAYYNALLDISPTYVGITAALTSIPYTFIECFLLWYGKTSISVKTFDELTNIFEGTILLIMFGNTIFCMGTYEKYSFDLIGKIPWKKESIQSYPAVKI